MTTREKALAALAELQKALQTDDGLPYIVIVGLPESQEFLQLVSCMHVPNNRTAFLTIATMLMNQQAELAAKHGAAPTADIGPADEAKPLFTVPLARDCPGCGGEGSSADPADDKLRLVCSICGGTGRVSV